MPERSVFGVSKGDRSPWKEERTGPKWRPRKRQGDVTKRVGRNQPDFPTAERFSSMIEFPHRARYRGQTADELTSWAISSAVRAPALHAGWRGFESLIAHLAPMIPMVYRSAASDESACEWRKRSGASRAKDPPEARATCSGSSRRLPKSALICTPRVWTG
jgi:hypothetical protein